MSDLRVRFAPSPTGHLHIGGARTALFNYLLAKKQGGKYVLRIEDTDVARSTQESVDAILQAMDWLGFAPDEGPHYQSQRFDLYQEKIDQLLKYAELNGPLDTAEQELVLDVRHGTMRVTRQQPENLQR